MTVSTRLLITRHGEAACNVAGIVGGDIGCTGLTTCGREQVARLGARLAAEHGTDPFDVLYASPRLRAQQSAQILAGALRIESTIDPSLVGPDHGEADGMAWNDVKTAFAGPSQAYPHLAHAPGAETWLAYLARTFSSLTHLLDLHAGQKILIAGHGETIEAANTLLLELPAAGCSRISFTTAHASITRWERHTNRFGRTVWNLAGHNDSAHLGIGG
jgi:2,3-bisphosphoglycerate-dependent phosphoglycerate mutase